jgi:hypothetical protein
VGANDTLRTPIGPETMAVPEQEVAPMHPRRTRYCCWSVPAGTVNCTCEHVPHSGGGPAPEPVSSYTNSTPAGEKTRSVVWPVHDAPV